MKEYFKLVEWYHTVQTEGRNAGRRALFLRLPFCNLNCSWCDTEFNTFLKITKTELIDLINVEKCRFAVITGGEPTMNKQLPELIKFLKSFGFEIAVETNGNFPVPANIDWVTVSPKEDSKNFNDLGAYYIDDDAFAKASEFKYVVDDNFDLSILDKHQTGDGRFYYLSPEYNRMKESLEKIFDVMKKNSNWRLSLQTHKWMGIE